MHIVLASPQWDVEHRGSISVTLSADSRVYLGSLTDLECTTKCTHQHCIEKKHSARIETRRICWHVIKYTSKNERDEEISEDGRCGQAGISFKALKAAY